MGHCECRDGCPLGCYVIRDQCICPPTDIRSAPFCCPGCTGWCSGFGCMGYCPYENFIQESCSSLAVQAHGESCKSDCADTSNSGCQSCLETSLPNNCQTLSGFSCWRCTKTVWDAVTDCDFESNILEKLTCIINTLLNTECSKCVCTLLCYFFPHSSLCSICKNYPQNTVNYESCPGGGVLTDGYCFNAYAEGSTFDEASAQCASFNGELAKVDSRAKVYAVTEAILNAQVTECWIGGRRGLQQVGFQWEDGTTVEGGQFCRRLSKRYLPFLHDSVFHRQ